MKTQDILFLLVVLGVVVLVVTRTDDVRRRLDHLLNPEPTPSPTVCDNFEFQELLPRGTSLRTVEPVDINDDGIEECVVLYDGLVEGGGALGRPVYGLVYHFRVSGPVDPGAGRLPISEMHRYELRTDHGRQVRLGLARSEGSNFQVLTMDADTQGGPELVVLSRDSGGQLVGLCVFRWRGDQEGYQLVGYAHGDWLETKPDPLERYVDEVVVCDRQYPADANNPDRATGQVFIWQDGKLMPDPDHSSTSCLK